MCGHNFEKAIRRLQDNRSVVCPSCGGDFEVNLQDEHGLEMTTKFGLLQVTQGTRGSVSFSIEVYHEGLNKHRLIRGPDAEVIQAKTAHQAAEWNELWAKKVAAKQKMTVAERKKEEAADRTSQAQRTLQTLRDVLSSSLAESKAVDWEALKDETPFPRPVPMFLNRPLRP